MTISPVQTEASPRKPQARVVEAVDSMARASRRKRLSAIHRGACELVDAAVEARRDTEEVSRGAEVRRADLQDLFAWQTRRLVRKLEGDVRELRALLRRAA